jgi:hypothetical protein
MVHQLRPHWILQHVTPLAVLLLPISKTVMEDTRLEPPLGTGVCLPKLAFPILNPSLDGSLPVMHRRETMKMVGHENIAPDEPIGGIPPNCPHQVMNLMAGQPASSVMRTDGQENNGRQAGNHPHAWFWSAPNWKKWISHE